MAVPSFSPAPPSGGTRLTLFDLPLDPVTLEQALDRLGEWMFRAPRAPHTVVTLNPELVVQSRAQPNFAAAIRAADLVTADGVGIVWAARQLHGQEVPRAPGYDLVRGLLERHGPELRVFFLGAKPGVAERAAQNVARDFGVQVAGVHHGYFDPADDGRVADLVGASGAHLVLTAMGAGRQELFNQYWRQVLGAPVLIGCGGVIDVLAGSADLAPAWTRRAGVEFLWRVGLDRRRWHRVPRLLQFVRLVQAERRGRGER
ncbi:UDP-N-acetyl-D-mannosaminuronic acid transferase [Deinococcus sp. RL]|uniref:WecB/TagA/CpsF family glycosyltransferase n=1 Tax=Deinococcus sp. RL TaxID=1489678 RepID=UPI0004D4C62F|nr:WecB/TagA/CpsF family glycosyltransferase [Deinococcus sp. RL]KEF35091.1 UDP-N-acetyl-D-mannosaminuronic acid transferase [Deinococcus sp. RL]